MHPLGGLARRSFIVEKLRQDADGVLAVDAGDDLCGPPVPAGQHEIRGRLILDAMKAIGVEAWQTGEHDREANIPLQEIPGHAVVTRAGVKIGIFSRDLDAPVKVVEVAPSVEAAALRNQGAELVVALFHGNPEHVKDALIGAVGSARIDVVVASHSKLYGVLEKLGETWLVECPPQDKNVCELDLHLVGKGAERLTFLDGGQRTQMEQQVADQKRELIDLAQRAETAAPSVRDYIQQRRDTVATTIRNTQLELEKLPPLTTHSWLENVNIPLNADIPDEPHVGEMVRAYKDHVATLPPPPAKMESPEHNGFAGAKKCAECHAGAYAFWQTTKHAKAMASLVVKKSDKDPACTSCHVTGGLLTVPDVQCEACHGGAQAHSQRPTQKGLVRRAVPEGICTSCHSKAQAPDFNFAVYRAAIVGPGHGK